MDGHALGMTLTATSDGRYVDLLAEQHRLKLAELQQAQISFIGMPSPEENARNLDKQLKSMGMTDAQRAQAGKIVALAEKYANPVVEQLNPNLFARARQNPQQLQGALEDYCRADAAAFAGFARESFGLLGRNADDGSLAQALGGVAARNREGSEKRFYSGATFDTRLMMMKAGFALEMNTQGIVGETDRPVADLQREAEASHAFLAEAKQRFPAVMDYVEKTHRHPNDPSARPPSPEEERQFQEWARPRLVELGMIDASSRRPEPQVERTPAPPEQTRSDAEAIRARLGGSMTYHHVSASDLGQFSAPTFGGSTPGRTQQR